MLQLHNIAHYSSLGYSYVRYLFHLQFVSPNNLHVTLFRKNEDQFSETLNLLQFFETKTSRNPLYKLMNIFIARLRE